MYMNRRSQRNPPPLRRESQQSDVLDSLTRIGDLKNKGILTEEFTAKKAELLHRL